MTLSKIAEKYSHMSYNDDNYSVGGGLDSFKFASNRHEEALNDSGKMTLGKACQMFKKATGVELEVIKELIKETFPLLEWHHAGKLPKQYGGGMKKTYFINAAEIAELATNWDSLSKKVQENKRQEEIAKNEAISLDSRRSEFLKNNAHSFSRIERSELPTNYIETDREMSGKYGWFSSYGKSYNLPEYYSGWSFNSVESYNEYLKIN